MGGWRRRKIWRSRVARLLPLVVVGAIVAMPGTGGAAASACATHTAWTTFGFDTNRTGFNPCETIIGPSTARGLHLLWSANLSGASIAQPMYAPGIVVAHVARNLVFVADELGTVQALDASTGAVVWTRTFGWRQSKCFDLPKAKFGISGALALNINTRTGYMVDGLGQMYAINLATGQNRANWPISLVDPTLDHVYGAVNLSNGTAYVTTASYCDLGTYYGKVIAVDVRRHKIRSTWKVVDPSLNPGQFGGGIWGPGGVAVDAAAGAVYAATGNSLPSEHVGFAEQIVRLDTALSVTATNYTAFVGNDVDYGATPLLFQPPGCQPLLAAKNKSGVLVVYNRNTISGGPTQKLQVASSANDQFNGIPAYSPVDNMVYVSNSSTSDDGTLHAGLIAFAVQPDCSLAVAWSRTFGINGISVSPPTVANGVVYEGDGPHQTLHAFDSHTGVQLWTSAATIKGPIFAAPTVADGRLFAVAWDNKVYAFGP